MTTISLIAAIDEFNGLGINNQLCCHLPADLQHFKRITLGKPIIMGRTTFEAIGKPLPGRLNIILSRNLTTIPDVKICDSMDKALSFLVNSPEIMIIGGGQIYKQTIELANRLYITRIHHQFKADVYFPKIEENVWSCKSMIFHKADEKNKYDMTFYIYEKI